jgi:hypothetical protein
MYRDALEASVWGLHVMLIDKSSLLIAAAAPRDDFQRLIKWRPITQHDIIEQGFLVVNNSSAALKEIN